MSAHVPEFKITPPPQQPLGECSPETIEMLDILGANPIAHLSIAALARTYQEGEPPLTVNGLQNAVIALTPPDSREKLPGMVGFRSLCLHFQNHGLVASGTLRNQSKYFYMTGERSQLAIAFTGAMTTQQEAYSGYGLPKLWGRPGKIKSGPYGSFALRHSLFRALEAQDVTSPTLLARTTGVPDSYTRAECNRLTANGIVATRPQRHPKERIVSFTPPNDMPSAEEPEEVKLLAEVARIAYLPESSQTFIKMSEHELRRILQTDHPDLAAGLRLALVEAQARGSLPFIHYLDPYNGIEGTYLVELQQIWRGPLRGMLQALVQLSDGTYRDKACERVNKFQPSDAALLLRHYTKVYREAQSPGAHQQSGLQSKFYFDNYGV